MAPTISANTVLDRAIRMAKESALVALDLETTGLNPRESSIRLAQIANGDETFVIDLWRNRNPTELFEALAETTVVAHGATFEWSMVYHHFGIELNNIRDTMLMSQILNMGDMRIENNLEAIALRELNVQLDKEMQTSDWTAEKLSDRQLNYAALDAQVLIPLYNRFAERLAKHSLERVAAIENATLPSVARMKLEGMPVDVEAWYEYADAVKADLRVLERKMLEIEGMPEREPIAQSWALQGEECLAMLKASGLEGVEGTTAKDLKDFTDHEIVKRLLMYRKAKGDAREDARAAVLELAPIKPPKPAPPWNFGSPDQVHDICYELLGFCLDSTNEAQVLRYVNRHPFFRSLLEYRKLKKLTGTYGKGWFKDAYDTERNRVHPGWRQIGTSTGRFACAAPNAQNLPSDYRRFFVVPEGRMFVDVDYSQIEIRIAAKRLNVKALLKMYEEDAGADVYKATAANMLGIDKEEVSKKQRQLAKAIMLGMLYGLSAYGLPTYAFKNYGIEDMSQRNAEAYVRAFYDLYPEIEDYHNTVLAELEEAGSVDQRTMTGRLRAGITNCNEAINAPVQGSAADGLKAAMTLVYERLRKFDGSAFIVATIHDELLIECDEADAEEIEDLVKEAMLEAMNEIVNAEGKPVPILVMGSVTKVWAKD